MDLRVKLLYVRGYIKDQWPVRSIEEEVRKQLVDRLAEELEKAIGSIDIWLVRQKEE